jgi:hypothetical protein
MSAFGGKADIAIGRRHVRFRPKADINPTSSDLPYGRGALRLAQLAC